MAKKDLWGFENVKDLEKNTQDMPDVIQTLYSKAVMLSNQ